MKPSVITHLEIKCPDGNRHYYYGSMSAIFNNWQYGDIGVTLRQLYYHKLSPTHPFENNKCIIRQGTIVRKPQKPHAKYDPFN